MRTRTGANLVHRSLSQLHNRVELTLTCASCYHIKERVESIMRLPVTWTAFTTLNTCLSQHGDDGNRPHTSVYGAATNRRQSTVIAFVLLAHSFTAVGIVLAAR